MLNFISRLSNLIFNFRIAQQQFAWTYFPFTIWVGLESLWPQKCETCPSLSTPPELRILTEYGYRKCWVSPDWLSVHCYRSRPQSKKNLTGQLSSPSSSLCRDLLTTGNWGTWCCSWGLPQNRAQKSSGCNSNEKQFSLCCAQPWRRFAGLLRGSRCRKSKLLLLSFSLPLRTRRCRTSTLFQCCCLQYNWLRAVWGGQEYSYRGSWRGLYLRLKCSRPVFRWYRAAWVWKPRSL